MNKMFWELLEQSVLVTGTIAVVLVITMCICAVQQIPIPPLLNWSVGLALGFFFGAKTQRDAAKYSGR